MSQRAAARVLISRRGVASRISLSQPQIIEKAVQAFGRCFDLTSAYGLFNMLLAAGAPSGSETSLCMGRGTLRGNPGEEL